MNKLKSCLKISAFNFCKFLTITSRYFKKTSEVFAPFITPALMYAKNTYNKHQNNKLLMSLNKYHNNQVKTVVIKDEIFYNCCNNDNYKETIISNITFNNVTVIYDNISYTFENINNFMCVGNILQKAIFIWFMDFYHNIDISNEDDIILSILDNDCNLLSINISDQFIEIELDKYNIRKYNNN